MFSKGQIRVTYGGEFQLVILSLLDTGLGHRAAACSYDERHEFSCFHLYLGL